jgi:hypothetical protein
MSKQSDYQAPLVQPEKKIFRKLWKDFISNFEILKHSLVPHQHAAEAAKKFEASHFQSDASHTFEVSIEMYKESTKRIDALEEKGFKLLTYISAVSAILIYFLSKDIIGYYKFFVITSLFFLIIAIIISLRCISIKYQRVLFIDALFKFGPDAEPVTKDKKAVIAEILNCTVYNQTVADNTADILKGARIMLSYGIFTTVISCVFFLYTPAVKDESKVYQTKVTIADTAFKNSVISLAKNEDTSIKLLNTEIKQLNNRLDSVNKSFEHEVQKDKVQKPVKH